MTNFSKYSFPVVAVGASAGGIESAKELFQHIGGATGMAFIYVQHLSPDFELNLVTIIQKVTPLKVTIAEQNAQAEPNHLYIIPATEDIEFHNGAIHLLQRKEWPHMPIDRLMTSMAESRHEASIGVMLSSSGSDGIIGLKAIKTAGGITFAQDSSASFQSMPKAAIFEGAVDLVLSPRQIAEEINRLSQQQVLLKCIAPTEENDDTDISLNPGEIADVLALIKKLTAVDFSNYKINIIRRRIIRRLLLHRLTNVQGYFQYIRENPSEVHGLYNDLLIDVTSFFRDEEISNHLQKAILPELLSKKPAHSPVRIWIPGCSTGEEAYSIAMLIVEVINEHSWPVAVQIFATDLSEKSITKARLGTYSENEVANMSPERLQRFFTKIDGHYRVIKSIRDLCVFAPHNVLKDPPFSRIDIISCCNLLVYLDQNLQKKVISTFHYSLNEKGFLLLGKSETVGPFLNLFSPLDKAHNIYEKRDVGGNSQIEVLKVNYRENAARILSAMQTDRGGSGSMNLEKIIDSIVLTEFAPPCVVINDDFEIVQFRGRTTLFLEPAQGKPTLNILKMVRPGITIELRTAINHCLKTGDPVKKEGIQIKLQGHIHHVNIRVQSLQHLIHEQLIMVSFEEVSIPNISSINSKSENLRIRQVENEIIAVREEMRSLLEEHEAANKELQSANEENVSSNEELQSLNEELETSKDEIEWTIKELMTINSELMVRNDQLAESQEYTDAVFFTIREAVLILNTELRVKSANSSFLRIFQMVSQEVEGSLLHEMNNRQWNIPALLEVLQQLIINGQSVTGLEISHDFGAAGKKVLVLNARKVIQKTHRQQFVLLAIEDITHHKQNEKLQAEREEWLQRMTDNVPTMLWVAGVDKKLTYVNKTWLEFTGTTLADQLGYGWMDGFYKDDLAQVLEKYNQGFQDKERFRMEYRLRAANGDYRWVLVEGTPSYDTDGQFTGFTGSCTEIHDERLMNRELEERVLHRTGELQAANNNLEKSNKELEQFAYVASHDLQEPLRKIMTFSGRLEERYKDILPKPGQDMIDKILLSSERMRLLIDDLLNFSRISRQSGAHAQVDLNNVLKDILQDFELKIKESAAVIDIGTLPTIEALPVQMQQLFYNMMSNALKFTRVNVKPHIVVQAVEVPKEELSKLNLSPAFNYLKISFSDNGIGFNQEYAERAFEIFHRLHKEQFAGTGIGLALCRKIVEQHNGQIRVFSEENKGTIFDIYLPVKR